MYENLILNIFQKITKIKHTQKKSYGGRENIVSQKCMDFVFHINTILYISSDDF